jgi:hypothetical protein
MFSEALRCLLHQNEELTDVFPIFSHSRTQNLFFWKYEVNNHFTLQSTGIHYLLLISVNRSFSHCNLMQHHIDSCNSNFISASMQVVNVCLSNQDFLAY